MDNESAIKYQNGYYQGYNDGFKEGYWKAYETFKEQLLIMQNPRIIITTEENLEKVKEQFNK